MDTTKDTDGGTVEDTYGRRVGVIGDRSGAVLLDLGLDSLMFTPELWDELDARVRASFRPERLDRVRAGMTFEHAHFLNPKGGTRPARCTVTSVRDGQVYFTYAADYAAGDRAGAWYFPVDDIEGHVRRWL